MRSCFGGYVRLSGVIWDVEAVHSSDALFSISGRKEYQTVACSCKREKWADMEPLCLCRSGERKEERKSEKGRKDCM